jgi:hypothetical protein
MHADCGSSFKAVRQGHGVNPQRMLRDRRLAARDRANKRLHTRCDDTTRFLLDAVAFGCRSVMTDVLETGEANAVEP